MQWINSIFCGDCLNILKDMPDESVDCCVTSPPYWSLRDYGISGQLGLEQSFQLYIEHLLEIFDEIQRVLKKSGTVWVNLGDTYSSGNRKYYDPINHGFDTDAHIPKRMAPNRNNCGIADKSLCNIPHRFAIGMVDNGWILRNTIIWKKNS
ncbi:MAG: DNA methyltransferase, partial [Candidatus Methanoperedens sp.]